jgi:hypothetical protein
MSTDRDPTRIVLSWLHSDEYVSADRLLDDVLATVDTTPQRRPSFWAAWRSLMNNNFVRYGLAAAAVVVVAIVGINLLGPNLGGTPDPTPTIAPSHEPTATPIPPLPPSGALDPGTYGMPVRFGGVGFAFTVPAGWEVDIDHFVHKGTDGTRKESGAIMIPSITTGVILSAWQVDRVYADACHPDGTDLPVDASVDALATALAGQLGRVTSGPAEATVGGHPAQIVELTAAADLTDCGDMLLTWPDLKGGWLPASPNQIDAVYIVDVDGTRLVIVATHWAGTSAADLAELEAVVASIQIE